MTEDTPPDPSKRTRRGRLLATLLIAATAAAAGLTAAVALTGLTGGPHSTAAPAPGSPTGVTTSDTEIVLIHPDPTTVPAPDPRTSPTPTVTLSSGSTSSQTITNNSGTVTVTPKPSTTPKPVLKAHCPTYRSQNPEVYDACHAGFVAPEMVAKELVACKPADNTGRNWFVWVRYGLSGGNYKGFYWAGEDWGGERNSAVFATQLKGLDKGGLVSGLTTLANFPMVTFTSMSSKYEGTIRIINDYVEGEFDLSLCLK